MYRQSKSAAGVATEDALKDDGVEDASLHASWRDKAEIPPKKKNTIDKQTDFMVNRVSRKMKSAVCLSAHLSIFCFGG